MSFLGLSAKDALLSWNLFKMSLRDRYMGSALGTFWAVLTPLCMLGMYTFIFGFIFKAKVPGAETTLAYAIWLISGLVPYQAFSEGVNATANSVIGGANMIKNIAFNAETLVVAASLLSLVSFGVGMAFLLVLSVCAGNWPTWHIIFLCLVIPLQLLLITGLGLFLSAFAVFVRDTIQILPTLLMFLMFFTPIFYAKSMMPDIAAQLTFFNPLFQLTDAYRRILLDHAAPDLFGLAYLAVLCAGLNLLGLLFFRRLKGFFETAL